MVKRKGWATCDICGASMRKERLKSHIKKVHPRRASPSKAASVAGKRREARRSTMLHISIVATIVIILILTVVFWPQSQNVGVQVGDKPPDFTLQDPDGYSYTFYDYVEDSSRPVFLEFFWTTCYHCRNMAPVLHAVYTNYSDKVDFFSIACGEDDDDLAVKNFIANYEVIWPCLVDKGRKVKQEYGANAVPTFYIIDKDGMITWTSWGKIPQETLVKELDRVF
jgi:thiol-disulfide isomerase/thioredoxin